MSHQNIPEFSVSTSPLYQALEGLELDLEVVSVDLQGLVKSLSGIADHLRMLELQLQDQYSQELS